MHNLGYNLFFMVIWDDSGELCISFETFIRWIHHVYWNVFNFFASVRMQLLHECCLDLILWCIIVIHMCKLAIYVIYVVCVCILQIHELLTCSRRVMWMSYIFWKMTWRCACGGAGYVVYVSDIQQWSWCGRISFSLDYVFNTHVVHEMLYYSS